MADASRGHPNRCLTLSLSMYTYVWNNETKSRPFIHLHPQTTLGGEGNVRMALTERWRFPLFFSSRIRNTLRLKNTHTNCSWRWDRRFWYPRLIYSSVDSLRLRWHVFLSLTEIAENLCLLFPACFMTVVREVGANISTQSKKTNG